MSTAAERILKTGMRLPPLPTIRDLVKLYKIQAAKRLSQNFLMDERLTDKIVKSAGSIHPRDTVLEVGPGPGGITRSILRRCPRRLILVEKDRRFSEILLLLKESGQMIDIDVDMHIEDVMRFDIERAMPDMSNGRLHLIGNLPFSISTALLIKWLEDVSLKRGAFRRMDTQMTLTFQQEVAERICAPLGHEERCRLSIMSQIWTQPVLKFMIPGTAFVPKPQVNVGVVKIIPLYEPKTDLPFRLVERVVRTIFNMRQKYMRRGFSNLFPEDGREYWTHTLLERAEVKDTIRPFQLSVDEYIRLCTVYAEHIEKYPEVAAYDFRAPKKARS